MDKFKKNLCCIAAVSRFGLLKLAVSTPNTNTVVFAAYMDELVVQVR
jgi:hypothetical protein